MTARAFLYVQHLLGIGHLARTDRIAQALRQSGIDVQLAVGGVAVDGFPSAGLNVLRLPPLRAGASGFAELADEAGKPVDDDFKARRVEQLLAAYRAFQPDMLLIEAFPFGRRAMRFEILPLLDTAKSSQRAPLIASSVRDILQQSSKPGRAEEAAALVEKYFDLVLVHGDPAFARLEESFPLAGTISKEIVHTGLVAGPPPRAPPAERFDVVMSAGGGAAGLPLVRAAAQMAARLPRALRCCLITGPNLAAAETADIRANAPPNLEVVAFRSDFPNLLRGAELSVSQAGYNTVCDVLRAGCRALLVPFAAGGETEQTARAVRMQQLGLAEVVAEDRLDAESLHAAAVLLMRQPKPAATALDLNGAQRTADILLSRLARQARPISMKRV